MCTDTYIHTCTNTYILGGRAWNNGAQRAWVCALLYFRGQPAETLSPEYVLVSLGCFCLDYLGPDYSGAFSHAYVVAANDGKSLSILQPECCAHWCQPPLCNELRTSLLLQDTELSSVSHKSFVVASPVGTKWKGYILTEVSCSAGDHVFQVQWEVTGICSCIWLFTRVLGHLD